jgi:hypothetical protein
MIKLKYNKRMNLMRLLKSFFVSCLAICIIAVQPCFSTDKNDVDSHLAEYSKYSVNHHDNIDDEPHAHRHKHSENGDEHEHNHEHSKVTQSELKLLSHSTVVATEVTIIESGQVFSEKNLISNPHPSGIYRPPIRS